MLALQFSIIDAVRAGICEAAVLTNAVLDGAKGKKGLGDLFIYKLGMRDYLLNTFICQVIKDDAIKSTFRSNLWDHTAYRMKVSGYENEVEPNLSSCFLYRLFLH